MILSYKLESGKELQWEVHKCSTDEWINSTLNDQGLYKDITDEVVSDFSWVVLGDRDTLFIIDVDIHRQLNYYIGYPR